ncbi:MAG: 7-cyano-7-deazaguanine synthase [Planctomycetota bacterium]
MAKVVVLSGGGIKSAVAAARYTKEHELAVVHVNYGQPSASREQNAIVALLQSFPNARLIPVTLPHVAELERGAVALQKPGVVGLNPQPMPRTRGVPVQPPAAALIRGLVPMLMATGVQAALRGGASTLVSGMMRHGVGEHLGLSRDDESRDARREFLHAFAIAVDALLGGRGELRIEAPLIDLAYADAIKLASRFGVPLDRTWTCICGYATACAQCEPCKARAAAFTAAGLTDPAVKVDPSLQPA